MQLLLLQTCSLEAESLMHSAMTCTGGLYCCQRLCWRAVFTSNWTGKATCVGYKLYFERLVLHFWNQFYKRRQWRDPREKIPDSNPIFSRLQTRTQVRFSVRLEDASHLKWLERKDANEVLKFLRWPEVECNSCSFCSSSCLCPLVLTININRMRCLCWYPWRYFPCSPTLW